MLCFLENEEEKNLMETQNFVNFRKRKGPFLTAKTVFMHKIVHLEYFMYSKKFCF